MGLQFRLRLPVVCTELLGPGALSSVLALAQWVNLASLGRSFALFGHASGQYDRGPLYILHCGSAFWARALNHEMPTQLLLQFLEPVESRSASAPPEEKQSASLGSAHLSFETPSNSLAMMNLPCLYVGISYLALVSVSMPMRHCCMLRRVHPIPRLMRAAACAGGR